MSSKLRAILLGVSLAAAAFAAEPEGAKLETGKLPQRWLSGGPNCVTVPDWQVHEYNENFYILRESGCTHYEKPFLYLIFGQQKALLEDTGAGVVQTAPFISSLIEKWAVKHHRAPVQLVVIHSHGHGDHTAGDKQFQALPNVEFIGATPGEIQKAAGIANWPVDQGKIDLGGRVIDVIPIPGHHAASIALYDRVTGNLLTGDSLNTVHLRRSHRSGRPLTYVRGSEELQNYRAARVSKRSSRVRKVLSERYWG